MKKYKILPTKVIAKIDNVIITNEAIILHSELSEEGKKIVKGLTVGQVKDYPKGKIKRLS